MFFSSLKTKAALAMGMLAAMAGNFAGILPPLPIANNPASPEARRRGNNRATPRLRQPNSERTEAWHGGHVRSDNERLPHGVPGAKLARKAAEGRLGLYAGTK